jgi:hypothetical protein
MYKLLENEKDIALYIKRFKQTVFLPQRRIRHISKKVAQKNFAPYAPLW